MITILLLSDISSAASTEGVRAPPWWGLYGAREENRQHPLPRSRKGEEVPTIFCFASGIEFRSRR